MLFNARPWKKPSPVASSEGGETVDPVAVPMFVEKAFPEDRNQRCPCHVQRCNHGSVLRC